jgi:hypothetical protein
MWTLVIITLMASQVATGGPNRSGVSTTTALVDFPDQSKCDAAAAAIRVGDADLPSGTIRGATYRVRITGAAYRIIATCVAR